MFFQTSTSWCSIFLVIGILSGLKTIAFPADKETGVATAPAGTDVFESSFEGTWFVDRQLKKKYDALIAKVADVEQKVRTGTLSTMEAHDEIAKLRTSLKEVRELIDNSKKLVSPFEIVTQEVEGKVELGPERLLVVTADRLKVIGWDEPFAKYVVVKKILSTGLPEEKHFEEIKIVHEHRLAPDLVGKTDAEMKAWRDEFLAPKAGETQTAEQLESKKATWNRYFAHSERFAPFVGSEVDTLHIEGLTGQEGNKHLRYELKSPDGGGEQYGGRWKRNAEVTLYVPKCTALLLRGCQMGMDISGVKAHLMMTPTGSQNRDYEGKFSVRNHTGQLTIMNVPIDVIDTVAGDVTIQATTEMVNTGSHHSGEDWIVYTPPPRQLTVSNVTGNLTTHFSRSNLHIEAISGLLNIQNEYGDTHCFISKPLSAGNHRIVSQSGGVEVRVKNHDDLTLPVFAATNCGTIATNFSRKELDDLNVTYNGTTDGLRRGWRSLHSQLPDGDFSARFALHERPDDILHDRQRSQGLDLLSVAGRIGYYGDE